MKEATVDDLSNSRPSGRPIIFGEVLLDHFPDGRQILGGAPFNVAWNLRGLGFDPFFVSGIGDDDAGEMICGKMSAWGLDQSGLQKIEGRPTGKVTVTISNNQPSYEIATDQAYDFVAPLDVGRSCERCTLLYHGSMIFRGKKSRSTLQQLIRESGLPRFVDVNLRQPHFDKAWLPELLDGASWVKLNDDELGFLSGVPVDGEESVKTAVNKLRVSFGPATYFVTCGARGAHAIEGDRSWFAPAPKPLSFRDSVGAGDAFAAATIGGLLRGNPPRDSLIAAAQFASRICGIAGGTSSDLSVYQETSL